GGRRAPLHLPPHVGEGGWAAPGREPLPQRGEAPRPQGTRPGQRHPAPAPDYQGCISRGHASGQGAYPDHQRLLPPHPKDSQGAPRRRRARGGRAGDRGRHHRRDPRPLRGAVLLPAAAQIRRPRLRVGGDGASRQDRPRRPRLGDRGLLQPGRALPAQEPRSQRLRGGPRLQRGARAPLRGGPGKLRGDRVALVPLPPAPRPPPLLRPGPAPAVDLRPRRGPSLASRIEPDHGLRYRCAPMEPWHLLGIEPLGRGEIEGILRGARALRELLRGPTKKRSDLRGKTVINLFFENSTRTRVSFEMAAKILGADAINWSAAGSSQAKGETFLDTIRTLEAMRPDVLVIRHAASGAAELAARHVRCSVVNAGDGAHEHPT